MSDIPTHLIMVLNRETFELKLVSAHLAGEAQAAFENLSSLFANTANDVYKVTVPSDCGFVIGEIVSSQGQLPKQTLPIPPRALAALHDDAAEILAASRPGRNGIHRNERGEYVQKLADGSEIISENDFSD